MPRGRHDRDHGRRRADDHLGRRPAARRARCRQRLLERVLARNPGPWRRDPFLHPSDRLDRPPAARRAACRPARADRAGGEPPRPHAVAHLLRRRPLQRRRGGQRRRDRRRPRLMRSACGRRASDYRSVLLAHNMHFAIESALARGDGETALAVVGQYRAELSDRRGRQPHRACSARRPIMPPASTASRRGAGAAGAGQCDRQGVAPLCARRGAGPAAATRPRCGPRRRRSRRCARARDAPALGRGGEALAEVFQHVLEGRAAMLAGDAGDAASGLSQGDGPAAGRRVRQRSAALLVFGAAQPRRRPARGRRRRGARAPARGLAAHTGRTIRSRSTPCRSPSGASAMRGSADRNLARARAVWAGDVTSVPLARI